MSILRLHLLGAFQATLDGNLIRGFRSDKSRALLAYLATQEGRPCARENLVGLFWGEDNEKSARASLRQVLSNWRKIFAPLLVGNSPPLEIGRRNIRLLIDSELVWVDVLQMQALITACGQHQHASLLTCKPCHERLAKAVSLYQGEFLADLQILNAGPWFDDWRLVQQEQFHQKTLQALGLLAEGTRTLGEREQEIDYLRRQLILLPWLEETHRLLMSALAETGRRAEAIAQFETCQNLLDQELGVEPAQQTLDMYQEIAEGKSISYSESPLPKHNLTPAQSSFIGREKELTRIDEILNHSSYRLITLTGLGGVGKTRLARAAASQQLPRFAHGVWFISFAEIQGVQAIGSEVELYQSLAVEVLENLQQRVIEGEQPFDQLCEYLYQKEILLIFDNLEQLLPQATGFVLTLLESAPGLRIIATSQTRLNSQAEMPIQIGGLALDELEIEAGTPSASIQLFLERAQRYQPEFRIDAQNKLDVSEICRLAAGLPLAIELAAELINHYPLPEIAAAISENLNVLESQLGDMPPRQQSMRAVLNYGLELLTDQEKLVLSQASVFVGEFDRESILAVTEASLPDVVRLVNRTWITLVRPGRYRLHGFIRQVAAERLAENHQSETETHLRFARYFSSFLQRQAVDLTNANQSFALDTINKNLVHIRRTWQWFINYCDNAGLEMMMPGLGRFFGDQGRYWEGVQIFNDALAHSEKTKPCFSPTVQNHLAYWQAHFLYRNSRYQEARSRLETLRPIFQSSQDFYYLVATFGDLGSCLMEQGSQDSAQILDILEETLALSESKFDDNATAAGLTKLGRYWAMVGQYEKASLSHQRSVQLRRRIGAPRQLATALNQWALLLHRQGKNEKANELLKESAQLNRQMGSIPELATALSNRGLVETALTHYEEAEALLQEAWQIQAEQGNRTRVAIILNNLGDIANLQNNYRQALAYLEESLRIKTELNNKRGMTFSLIHLGHAYFGLDDFRVAQKAYFDALEIAVELSLQPLELAALVGVAQLLARTEVEKALVLLQLPLTHPASWQRVQEEAQILSEQLSASLLPSQKEDVFRQGKDLNLDDVVDSILQNGSWY